MPKISKIDYFLTVTSKDTLSTFKRHLKFRLFQSAFTV